MLSCPRCKHDRTMVKDSRGSGRNIILRRRECNGCFHVFSTAETYQDTVTGQLTEEKIAADYLGINLTTLRKVRDLLNSNWRE